MLLRLNAVFFLYTVFIPETMFTPHNPFGSISALEGTFLLLDRSLQGPAILNMLWGAKFLLLQDL